MKNKMPVLWKYSFADKTTWKYIDVRIGLGPKGCFFIGGTLNPLFKHADKDIILDHRDRFATEMERLRLLRDEVAQPVHSKI